MDTGIGPTGCERMLSIMTSSLLLAKTRARLKTISGLIWPVMISPDLHFYRESTVSKVSVLFFTFVDSRQQRILYFLVAYMPVEIFMRQGRWSSISKGSVMVSLKWFTIAWTCSSSRFKVVCFISSCEVLLVLVIPALSFIALINDARKCLVSVHLTRADFWFVIPTIPPEPFESFMMVFFSAHFTPNTIEAAGCLSNGKLAFFKGWFYLG